ncbi:MAG: cytochrome P450, partial [Candidatus Sericytochromatia bacterium]
LEQVLGGRPPDVDDLPRLTYTRQVMTESMRLFPPAWVLGRRALNDYRLGAYRIPQGSIVTISQFLVHRSPRFFADPLSFCPERWTPEFKRDLPKFAYFPFGGGPRNCIGEAFAWMEGTLLLASLGQHWRFRLQPGQRVEPQPMVTLRPRNGLQMRLEARVPAAVPVQV